jgi:hypothetical protein
MSRIISVPARYAPFVEQTLAAMQATIDCDELLSGTDSPWPTGTVKKSDARGTLMITVAALPAEASVRVFPQVEPPAMEKSA